MVSNRIVNAERKLSKKATAIRQQVEKRHQKDRQSENVLAAKLVELHNIRDVFGLLNQCCNEIASQNPGSSLKKKHLRNERIRAAVSTLIFAFQFSVVTTEISEWEELQKDLERFNGPTASITNDEP